jgi:hypothetical protein
MREILQGVNANEDPDEDPLTKQMRMASAMQRGLIDVSPKAAMAAGDQLVKLSQAKVQQRSLNADADWHEAEASKTNYQTQIAKNTPQMVYLATDGGTDKNGVPLGLQQLKGYDMSDPNNVGALKGAFQNAQDNGQKVQVVTEQQLMEDKLKVAQANYAAKIQAAQIAASERLQAAILKSQQGGGSNATADRFTDRVFAGADMAIGGIESIARMPMGTSRGLFVDGQLPKAGKSLFELSGENLRNELTTTDQQLYGTFIAGIGNNLAAVETQGLGQGLQQLATRLQDKVSFKPGDSPTTMMGKLAEMRDTIDRGIAVKLADPKVAPEKKDEMRQMLDRLHTAVPFTRNDVVAFSSASSANPSLTFGQWAKTQGLHENAKNGPPNVPPPPQLQTDARGVPAAATF